MTHKEIIFKSQSHPEWKEIKLTDPIRYEELRRKSIADRLEELLPIFNSWRRMDKRFLSYSNSLPDIHDQLKSIDYNLYHKDIQSRLQLSDAFFSQCMCYPIDQLINASEVFSSKEWIIKALINKSVVRLYKKRNLIHFRISVRLGLSNNQIESLPLWGYVPFYNHIIGLNWIQSQRNASIEDVAHFWEILLCFDEKLFSSVAFCQEIENLVGPEGCYVIAKLIINKMDRDEKFNRQEFDVSYKKLVAWKKDLHREFNEAINNQNSSPKQKLYPEKKMKVDEKTISSSTNHDSIVKTEETIIRDVAARELTVNYGSIVYKKHTLISSRIKSEVPDSILSLIDYGFNLKLRVNRIKSGKVKNRSFRFEPVEDLYFLLAECERIKDNISIQPLSFFPQNGVFALPWRYVTFYDRVMYLSHPNPSKYGSLHPFTYRHPSITKSFRDLMTYIENRCPQFKVKAKDGVIVELLNFRSFEQMIPQFREYSSGVHGGIDNLLYSKLSNEYSSSDFSNLKFVNKSLYLSHLAKLQVSSRKIYRILERVIHAQAETDNDEFGFLFTVKEYRSYSCIVYENVSDESRSSILFQVRTADFDNAIETIRSFFASREVNKRQRLAQSTIRFKSPAILSLRRIHHTSFSDWRSLLSSLL